MLYSPINYQGNKSRICENIVKLIPQNIDCIHEIFCGSAIVSLVSNISKVYLNDKDVHILELLKYFQDNSAEDIIKRADNIIKNYGLTNTFYEGGSKSQFEPVLKNSNSRGFLQSADPYGSKSQFENGRSKSQFEPLTENEEIKVEKKMVDGKNKEMKVEDRRVCNRTNKTKEKQETEKRLSNHIEFIDYIPIHEVITYRHLFAYGFYVE